MVFNDTMQLITKEIDAALTAAGSRGSKIICKFFNPCGAATWLITGRDEEEKDILWGLADLGFGCVEFGTMSLSEMEECKLPFGLTIERDLHCNVIGKDFAEFLDRDSLAGV
jgi:hypothetical protein